jgi:hypothetical protein
VRNGDHRHGTAWPVRDEHHYVGEAREHGTLVASIVHSSLEPLRTGGDPGEHGFYFIKEPRSQALTPRFVPSLRVLHFLLGTR